MPKLLVGVVASLALAAAGCRGGRHTAIGVDPPLLVPWSRIGGVALGESKARVEREYGSEGHGYHVLVRNNGIVQGYYRLHGSRVFVTFQDGRSTSSNSRLALKFVD